MRTDADARLRRLLLGLFIVGLCGSVSIAELALSALVLRFGWRLATGRTRGDGWPLALPILAWIGAAALSALRSPRPLESLAALEGFHLFVTLWVILDALTGVDDADGFVAGLLGVLALVSVLAIVQVGACQRLKPWAAMLGRLADNCDRAHGFFSIFMTFAGVLVLVLLVSAPRVLAATLGEDPPPVGVAGAVAWALAALALAATYVRGAWLGLLGGLAVLAFTVRRARVAAAVTAVVLAVLAAAVPSVRHRAASAADPADPTASDRLVMWKAGLEMAREHPLTGVGPGQVRRITRQRYASGDPTMLPRGHLHSVPVQILAETGVLALAAWVWLLVTFFRRAGAILAALPQAAVRERALVAGSIAAIAGFVVAGLTEFNAGDSEVIMTAYAIMALPFVVARERALSTRAPAPSPSARARSTP
jgi:O-antigen ligase